MIKIVSDFKTRLNQALAIREIKPAVLAFMTGISPSTISQYRSGYAEPKDDKLELICNALDVDPSWLKGYNMPMRPAEFATIEQYEEWAETNDYAITSFEYQLIVSYRKADEGMKEAVHRVLNIHPKEKNTNIS